MDEEIELIELSGTIESVRYKNEENGYTVISVRDGNDERHTAVGCFPYAAPGEIVILTGTWVVHPQHGEQFKAEFARCILPSRAEDIFTFLSSGVIKGVGPATASLIVNQFGDRTLDVVENDIDRLASVKGISRAKAQAISDGLRQQSGIRRIMEYSCSYGLRPVFALRMYRFYGQNALKIMQDNPYILATQHIGASFAEADNIALLLGFEEYCDQRIDAAVIFELIHNCGNGHCFIPKEKLILATSQLISADEDHIYPRIDFLSETGQLIVEKINDTEACYLPDLYEAETYTAKSFARMAGVRYSISFDIDCFIEEQERLSGIKLAPLQCSILEMVLNNQLVIVTGGPGTGKTTSIKAVIALLDRMKQKVILTAPTGRAAKRISELTGDEALTVHRLLEAKFSDDREKVVFGRNQDNKLDCDAVILDECSMVDIALISSLLKAMPENARLILVGDIDQLPPVGPGKMLEAAIKSGVIATVRLNEIFRQSSDSFIIKNAHLINQGKYPDFSSNRGDFFRLKRIQAATGVETITELYSRRLPQNMHIPVEDIQVISPTRKGEMGTAFLNAKIQEAVNPHSEGKNEKEFGEVVFRVGDRVMQVRNDYDIMWTEKETGKSGIGVFNGDIGYIISIDFEFERIKIDFDGRIAVYSFECLNEIEHAWAITVHKSQGSEYKAVILALSNSSRLLLTRDVLYTAVTRAKKLLVMVGDDSVATTMIDNYKKKNRYSFLKTRIISLANNENN